MKSKADSINEKTCLLWRKWFVCLLWAAAFFEPFWYYSCRLCWVFAEHETKIPYLGWSLLALMLGNAAALSFNAYIAFENGSIKDKKLCKAFQLVGVILSAIFAGICITFVIISPENLPVFLWYAKQSLPLAAVVVLTVFAAFIIPHFKSMRLKKIISACLVIAIAAGVILSNLNIMPIKFISSPVVFDNGKDYSIVWATNCKATGFVKYSYRGEEYTVFDCITGKTTVEEIHCVHVPYEHLTKNSYQVLSTKVFDELSYGGTLGRTIASKVYKFRGVYKDDMVFLSVSDWHNENDLLVESIANAGSFDVLFAPGDPCDAIYSDDDIIENMVIPLSEATGSVIPVIYTRGNHETRGPFAVDFAQRIGFDNFYFRVRHGAYDIVVFDSGEDKEDSNWEYGGLANFNQYRKAEYLWLKSLQKSGSEYTIALGHDPFYPDEWTKEFNRLGVEKMFSGHTGSGGLFNRGEEYKIKPDYPIILDGCREDVKVNGQEMTYLIFARITCKDGSISTDILTNLGDVCPVEKWNGTSEFV